MKVRVLSNQTLTDIAIQVYGSAEGVFFLAQENGLSVTDDLTPGQLLVLSPNPLADKKIVQYYADNGICPATSAGEISDNGIFDKTFDSTFN